MCNYYLILTHANVIRYTHTVTAIRQQSIIPNSSSFEAGSAEHLFAREQYIPSEHDVNALFDNMLVLILFLKKKKKC